MQDKKRIQNVIATAAHLGYSTVAINYVVNLQQRKQGIGQPKCVSELYDTFPVVQRPTAEYKAYDLVAVYPKTEIFFHAACMTFDVDIICVAVTEKQPFSSKWGVFIEISYAPAIRDSTLRRYTIANSISIVEMCKGKSLELRGPYKIHYLLQYLINKKDCLGYCTHYEERAAIKRQPQRAKIETA